MAGYDEIYFFGDSLSDGGNLFAALDVVVPGPLPPAPLGYRGALTNGPVHADLTPDLLGIDQSLNFAVAGAEVLGTKPLLELVTGYVTPGTLPAGIDPRPLTLDLNLEAQVDRFLHLRGDAPLENAAAQIFVGLNDLSAAAEDGTLSNPFATARLIDDLVEEIVAQALRLVEAGIDAIILNTLPAASFFPGSDLTPLEAAAADAGIALFNAALIDAAGAIEDAGAELVVVDTAYLTAGIAADPTAFGLYAPLDEPRLIEDEAGDLVYNPALAGVDEDHIAFWDPVHFSAATHGIVAAFTAESIASDVTLAGGGAEDLWGDAGDALVMASGGDDRITGGGGADVILAGLGADLADGGAGADILGGGGGDDALSGGAETDVLAGNDGDDLLSGGAGTDILTGGRGSDTVHGGSGADVFLFTEPSLIGGAPAEDLYDGGAGYDVAILEVSAESAAGVRAAVAAGETDFPELGLALQDIERVVIVTDLDPLLDGAADIDPVREADLWGLL